MESLIGYVVNRRERPQFREWRDSETTRALRDTLNETWDPEPDARLTCLCLVERMADLQNSFAALNNSNNSSSAAGDPSKNLSPLDKSPVADSPWAGRNPCLQRNLLFDIDTCDEDVTVLSRSEKKTFNNNNNNAVAAAMIQSSNSATDDDATTITTDLSSSTSSHFYNNSIPLIHNAI